LRRGQLAAAYAGAAHALKSNKPATIVMPTGSGKTAVMLLVAAFAQAKRVLVVVSSRALRTEIAEKFRKLDPFLELGLLPPIAPRPIATAIAERLETDDDWRTLEGSDVVVALPQSISPAYQGVAKCPSGLFDLVLMDEAHHSAAKTWKALLGQFEKVPRIMFTATPYRLDRSGLPGETIFTYPASKAFEEGVFGDVRYVGVDDTPHLSPDESLRDAVIAQLRKDSASGFDHRVLAKSKTIERAKQIADLYKAAGFRMEAVHSGLADSVNQKYISELRSGVLEGLSCANMLGEGFDEPRLKVAALHDQDKSLPVTLQFIGRFARTNRSDIGPAHFMSVPQVTHADEMLRDLYTRDSVWAKLVPNFSDVRIQKETDLEPIRRTIREGHGVALEPLTSDYWERLRPRQKALIFRRTGKLDLTKMTQGIAEDALLFAHLSDDHKIAICVEERDREPGWSEGNILVMRSATLYVAYWNEESDLLFFHCSADGSEHTRECLEAVGARDYPSVEFQNLNRIFSDEPALAPFSVGLRTRAHVYAAETYRTSMGKAAGDLFRSSDGLRYHRGHCAAQLGPGEILGMSDASKVWGGKNIPIDEFVTWCDKLANRITSKKHTVTGARGYFAMPVRQPADMIARAIAAGDWPASVYLRNLTLELNLEDEEYSSTSSIQSGLRDVDIKGEFFETRRKRMQVTFTAPSFQTAVLYEPEAPVAFTHIDLRSNSVDATRLSVRTGNGDRTPFITFLNREPPTLFSLYGAAMIGKEWLPELVNLDIRDEPAFYERWDWSDVNIKAERRSADGRSVQDKAIRMLSDEKPDVLFFDDGKGELADIVTVKSIKKQGEPELVRVGLAHCKASSKEEIGARLADYYELAGQAIKSASKLAFSEARAHIRRRVTANRNFIIGNMAIVDELLSGDIQRVYEYEISVIQPGLSADKLAGPKAAELAHLIAMTREMIDVADFAKFRFICS